MAVSTFNEFTHVRKADARRPCGTCDKKPTGRVLIVQVDPTDDMQICIDCLKAAIQKIGNLEGEFNGIV